MHFLAGPTSRGHGHFVEASTPCVARQILAICSVSHVRSRAHAPNGFGETASQLRVSEERSTVKRAAWVLVCTGAVSALGCSGGTSEELGSRHGPDGGTGGTETEHEGAGTPDGGGGLTADCANPLTAERVLDFDALPLPPGRDSPIYELSSDGDSLYFVTIDTLFSLPRAGGAPRELFRDEGTVGMDHFLRADDIVTYSSGVLRSQPRSGAAPTELPEFTLLPRRFLTGDLLAELVGPTFVAKAERVAFDEPVTSTFFTHELETGAETVLWTGALQGGRFVLDASFLYTTREIRDASDALQSTDLVRIALAGGEPEVLAVEPALARDIIPIRVVDDQLFVFAKEVGSLGFELARLPVSGGRLELLGESSGLGFTFPDTVSQRLPGGLLISANAADIHWLADGSTEAVRFVCLPFQQRYTMHAHIVVDGQLYLNVFDGDEERNAIVRIPMP
jgi:hypothetical protein